MSLDRHGCKLQLNWLVGTYSSGAVILVPVTVAECWEYKLTRDKLYCIDRVYGHASLACWHANIMYNNLTNNTHMYSCFLWILSCCFQSFPVCPTVCPASCWLSTLYKGTSEYPNSLNHRAIWLHLIHIRTDQSDAIYPDVRWFKSDEEPKQHVRVISQGNTAGSRSLGDTDASLWLEGHHLNPQIHWETKKIWALKSGWGKPPLLKNYCHGSLEWRTGITSGAILGQNCRAVVWGKYIFAISGINK